MVEQKLSVWSLDDHLREGRSALAIIEQQPQAVDLQPVCHHFSEVDPIDPTTDSRVATYSPAAAAFEALNLEFLSDRLEAWQDCQLSPDWLEALIPQMLTRAAAYGLIYEGWTWEPRGRQPIGTTRFAVINNTTDT